MSYAPYASKLSHKLLTRKSLNFIMCHMLLKRVPRLVGQGPSALTSRSDMCTASSPSMDAFSAA